MSAALGHTYDRRCSAMALAIRGRKLARAIAAVLLGVVASLGPAHANPGSGMPGDHPRNFLHEDLDALQEAHQFVVCGVRDQAWFDERLVSLARRAFADSLARAHGTRPSLTDVAFAIHDVVADNISVRTTLDDCRNLGSARMGDEGFERMREMRESIGLIQSGAIFALPAAVSAAPVASACVLRPPPHLTTAAAAHGSRPVVHARRQARPVVLPC